MASINLIKGSDGTGNASVPTVQSSRAPLATTLIVDTTVGINTAGFSGSMGTPHTFVDPVTSETITVISESTNVDFTGHVDGSNLEIDTIAPGYVDNGSQIGDIIVIKPTTQWANELADILKVNNNDDGTLKAGVLKAADFGVGSIPTPAIADDAVTLAKTESGFMKRLGLSTKTTNTTLLTTSYVTQITVTATSAGGECEAQFMITVRNAGAGAGVANGFLKVQCDGVDVTPIDLKAETADAGTPNTAYSLAFIVKSTPAAGSHTWTLQAKANLASSVYVDEGVLKITEMAS